MMKMLRIMIMLIIMMSFNINVFAGEMSQEQKPSLVHWALEAHHNNGNADTGYNVIDTVINNEWINKSNNGEDLYCFDVNYTLNHEAIDKIMTNGLSSDQLKVYYNNAQHKRHGIVALVLRGNSWYIFAVQ